MKRSRLSARAVSSAGAGVGAEAVGAQASTASVRQAARKVLGMVRLQRKSRADGGCASPTMLKLGGANAAVLNGCNLLALRQPPQCSGREPHLAAKHAGEMRLVGE